MKTGSLKSKSKYIIQFSGLALGNHEFDWELEPLFFEDENLIDILETSLSVHLWLNKTERMMSLDFHINGKIKCYCDRCGEELWLDVDSNDNLIARFGPETNFTDDEVIFLCPAEYELDVKQFIYEFVLIGLPARKTHEEGKCNSEVLEYLTEIEEKEESNDNDPRWKALEKLKKDV